MLRILSIVAVFLFVVVAPTQQGWAQRRGRACGTDTLQRLVEDVIRRRFGSDRLETIGMSGALLGRGPTRCRLGGTILGARIERDGECTPTVGVPFIEGSRHPVDLRRLAIGREFVISAGVNGDILCGESTTYRYRRTQDGFEFVGVRWHIVH